MASKLVVRRQRLFQSLFISALYLTPAAWAIDPCAAIISLQTLDRRGHESSVGELQHSAAMEIPLRNSPDGDAIAVMEEFVRKLFPPPRAG